MTLDSTLRALQIDRLLSGNLYGFVNLFEKWNRSINLSAASTRDEIVEHLVDSLHVVPHLRKHFAGRSDGALGAGARADDDGQGGVAARDDGRVLDVGSGGGFPVVVAAICLPSIAFTSLEPVHKKHAFLRTAARELGLTNLEALAMRIEDHEDRDYDVAMSRATFDLGEWLAMGLERVKPGGIVIGFEAVERTDLAVTIERHRYELANKQRAIVIAHRTARS